MHLAVRPVCQRVTVVEATCWKLDRPVVTAVHVLGWGVVRGRHAVPIVHTVALPGVVKVPVCVRLWASRTVKVYEHLWWLLPHGSVLRIWGLILLDLIVYHRVSQSWLLEVFWVRIVVALWIYRALARARVLTGAILEGHDWAKALGPLDCAAVVGVVTVRDVLVDGRLRRQFVHWLGWIKLVIYTTLMAHI